MTKKTDNGKGADGLAGLRQIIDTCDDALLQALFRRAGAVAGLAGLKKDGRLFRPGREAQIYRHLLAAHRQQAETAIAPGALPALWRHIITMGLAVQGKMAFHLCAPARWAAFLPSAMVYSGSRPVQLQENIHSLLACLAGNKQALGMVPAPAADKNFWRQGWWTEMPREIEIAARWPFLPQAGAKMLWILAAGGAEDSGNDLLIMAARGQPPKNIKDALWAQADGHFLFAARKIEPGARLLGRIALPGDGS